MSAPAHVEIDRTRLGRLLERERARFAEQHPRSRELYAESSQTLLGGVPMSWMTMWAGGFPLFMAEARVPARIALPSPTSEETPPPQVFPRRSRVGTPS